MQQSNFQLLFKYAQRSRLSAKHHFENAAEKKFFSLFTNKSSNYFNCADAADYKDRIFDWLALMLVPVSKKYKVSH
jgi:hypothetical protein